MSGGLITENTVNGSRCVVAALSACTADKPGQPGLYSRSIVTAITYK